MFGRLLKICLVGPAKALVVITIFFGGYKLSFGDNAVYALVLAGELNKSLDTQALGCEAIRRTSDPLGYPLPRAATHVMHESPENLLLAFEVGIKRAECHACTVGDTADARLVKALFTEFDLGSFQ